MWDVRQQKPLITAPLFSVYDWSRFDSLPRAYDWIRGELAANIQTNVIECSAYREFRNDEDGR
jgi:hypothetical protein